jgi:hypothetical protein
MVGRLAERLSRAPAERARSDSTALSEQRRVYPKIVNWSDLMRTQAVASAEEGDARFRLITPAQQQLQIGRWEDRWQQSCQPFDTLYDLS